jgi:glyoxylase-like metal-dependent hydrolase (beta-lactamase superfamily II)
MNEVLPAVLHWTSYHDGLGKPVHSHFAVASAALIDPRVPEGGIEEVARYGRPFRFGDEVAPGITALEMGALTPEDTVFRLAAGPGALLFADGLTRRADGGLAFVRDELMGDDPERVKTGLRASLERLLAEDFDALLFAHGDPMPSGGRDALAAFLAERA